MAESIIIHTTGDHAAKFIERIAARFGEEVNGHRASPLDDYLVLVYSYDDFEAEYEPSEKEEVISKLGGETTSSYCFEIRRSRSDAACDLLEDFIRHDLADLDYVVDDCRQLPSREEVEGDGEFLDLYHYQKQARKTDAPGA